MSSTAVTLKTFEHDVLASEQPVIVDFWAPWCGPCLAVAPLLQQIVAERHGDVKLVKVNIDEEQQLAGRYGISSIPTIVLFKDRKPGGRNRRSPRKATPRKGARTRSPHGRGWHRGQARALRAAHPARLLGHMANPSSEDDGPKDMNSGTDTTNEAPGIQDVAVVAWRRKQLLAAGFSLRASEALARECGVDLHALLDLVEHGCPPRLAVRILAPLDGESKHC